MDKVTTFKKFVFNKWTNIEETFNVTNLIKISKIPPTVKGSRLKMNSIFKAKQKKKLRKEKFLGRDKKSQVEFEKIQEYKSYISWAK